MKKISIVLLLIFILTGCIQSSDEGLYVYADSESNSVYYINGEYYGEINNNIMILKDNKFVEYRTEKDHELYLYQKSDGVYIAYYEQNERKYIEYLGNFDEQFSDFLKYDIPCDRGNPKYDDFPITYNKEELFALRIYGMNKERNYMHTLCYMYLDEDIYILVQGYYPDNPSVDKRINGKDYAGTELYKLDMENKQAVFIYRTGEDKAIVYGNENAIYYVDELYDIYRLDLNDGTEELIYDSISEKRLEVEYEHEKLFIFEEDKSIGVIDVY